MAFYGMEWLPTNESDVTPSEADPVEMIDLVQRIRVAGEKASQSKIAETNAQYQKAFANFQLVQQEYNREEQAIQERLATALVDDEERRVVKTLGKMQYKKDPGVREALTKVDRSIVPLVHQYASYLTKKDVLEATNAQLWAMYNTLDSAKASVGLWKFEAEVAEKQKIEMEKELSIEKERMEALKTGEARPVTRKKKVKARPAPQSGASQDKGGKNEVADNTWLQSILGGGDAGTEATSTGRTDETASRGTKKSAKSRHGKTEGEAFF